MFLIEIGDTIFVILEAPTVLTSGPTTVNITCSIQRKDALQCVYQLMERMLTPSLWRLSWDPCRTSDSPGAPASTTCSTCWCMMRVCVTILGTWTCSSCVIGTGTWTGTRLDIPNRKARGALDFKLVQCMRNSQPPRSARPAGARCEAAL